ncbi:ChaN family lipoprotein [Candidatus Moduliflexota bacterium]
MGSQAHSHPDRPCHSLFAALLSAAVLLLLSPPLEAASGRPRYIRTADQKTLPDGEAVADLAEARIIIFGETHGSRSHHEVQIALLRDLKKHGAEVVVGMEVFAASANPELERWSEGKMDSADIFLRFGDTWTFDWWPVYRDLLFFIQRERIPLFGINADEDLVRLVARAGLDGLDESTRSGLPDVSCSSDGRYLELLGLVMNGVPAGDGRFARFCEAQMLRDAVMAREAQGALKRWPGRIVVLLTGNFHAWRPGIASHLPVEEDLPLRIILPGGDVPFPDTETLGREADYIWIMEQ